MGENGGVVQGSEEVAMFTHHCTVCEREQLVFWSQATSVAESPEGLAVGFTCWCGAPQTWVAPQGDRRELRLAA